MTSSWEVCCILFSIKLFFFRLSFLPFFFLLLFPRLFHSSRTLNLSKNAHFPAIIDCYYSRLLLRSLCLFSSTMHILTFLFANFSVSNMLVLANYDNSDVLLANFPLLELPVPGSLWNPNLGNEYLNPSTSSKEPSEPSSFNVNLNTIHSETLADKPHFSPEIAKEPSINGAGDGGDSSIVTSSFTYVETPTHTDNSIGICNPGSSTGQKRRKRQLSCGNPAMLWFHQSTQTTWCRPHKARGGEWWYIT